MSRSEHVILLNDRGDAIGTAEKYAVHTGHTPLHLAFSCWLFNERGEMLLTRRALSKKAWPGVWTNSVCGHPQQQETFEQAIIRRCRFEVGAEIQGITPVYPSFRYRETDASGIVENEICPVYAAQVTGSLLLNPDEVMDARWLSLDAVTEAVRHTPFLLSPWMVSQYQHDDASSRLRAFSHSCVSE